MDKFLKACLFAHIITFSTLSKADCTNSEDIAFKIPRISEKIKVDAVLDEAAWKKAKEVNISLVVWPDENLPAPVKTNAYIMEDGNVLYVAFKAYDPEPENIRAFLTDRDSNWNDDRVGIKIDTYNDNALAYQFFINPLGTQTDAIENEITKKESADWNVIWDSAGRITDEGYIVEVAIPLRNLNFNDNLDIQQWGMEFVRFYPRNKELRLSNISLDHDNNCWICQMVTVEGFEGAKQGNNLTVVPTFVSGYSETREFNPNTDWQDESDSDAGLDVKWGITPDITLDATFNPDFSQVEADSGQLNVNSTFALFTPEKRSFFLANKDYFATPVDLIYTRNINAPDYGAKLTGKLNDHSFGFFAANDATTTYLKPGNLSSELNELDEESTNAAFRYRYNANDHTSLGLTNTVRESDSYSNHLTSVDGKYKLTDNDVFNVQFMHADTKVVDDFDYSDQAFRIDYRHENKNWFVKASHFNIGDEFLAGLAFLQNADFKKSVFGGGHNWRSEGNNTWWNRIELEGDWDKTTNQKGEFLEEEYEMFLNVRGEDFAFIRTGLIYRDKVAGRIDDDLLAIDGNSHRFEEKEIRSWSEYKPTANLWLGNFFKVGENIDYANKQLADSFALEPRFRWNINQHWSTNLTYKYNTLSKGGDKLYTAKLTDFRMTYQFSIRSFLRFTMVHYDITRNLDIYNEDIRDDYNSTYKSLASQLLFSYKVNPQTLFFVGYSDGGYQDDSFSDIKKDNRSVFMKLSYAWIL